MSEQPAWIDVVPPEDWPSTGGGALGDLVAPSTDPETGRVDHILQVHSLAPAGLRAHLQLYTHAMTGTPGLRKVDRELVALVVSSTNGCHY